MPKLNYLAPIIKRVWVNNNITKKKGITVWKPIL